MALSNSSGQPAANYVQDAFGNVVSGSANGYHLTTKEFHNDFGLYYFYKRWYDPMLGRFISRDPLGSFNNVNLYEYADNCPMKMIDVNGAKSDNPGQDEFDEECCELCEWIKEACEASATAKVVNDKVCKMAALGCKALCKYISGLACSSFCSQTQTTCVQNCPPDPGCSGGRDTKCTEACQEGYRRCTAFCDSREE